MKTKKSKKNKSVVVRLLVLGVCVYMVASLASLWNTMNDGRQQLAELEQEYAQKSYEIDELKALLENGSDEALIEKAARERLGYVYSDEQVYIDISGN